MLRGGGLPAVEARDFALGLAEFDALFEFMALVVVSFAFGDADFSFDAAVFPVEAQADDSAAFLGGQQIELEDFALVHKESAGAAGLVLEPSTCGFPRLNVAAVEVELTFVDAGKGVRDVYLASTDGFDLSALEFDTTF